MTDPLLQVSGLRVEYDGVPPVRAVDDVSLTLYRGEILGVAGESGSGKSTLVTALLRLLRPPARIVSGSAVFTPAEGVRLDLVTATEPELRAARWERAAVVFQSAMNALNPVARLGAQFVDAIRAHRSVSRRAALARAEHLLGLVGIAPDRLRAYPHELSGGMRQRVTIALALACEPDLVVLDEPTTAVDVVMQRQILRQVVRLKQELGFAVVFITHDLSLLIELADRIAVMYGGELVEVGAARELHTSPRHPYTRGLRDSFPPLTGPRRRLTGIDGTPPDPRRPPTGCRYHPRCPIRQPECRTRHPELTVVGDRLVACLRATDTVEPVAAQANPPAIPAARPAPDAGTDPPVLSAIDVTRHFGAGGGTVRALESVRLDLHRGRIVALVGESGSGKSTLARLLAGLDVPTAGRVELHGEPVRPDRRRSRRRYHRHVQMVLQDPFASLNPTRRVRHALTRPLRAFGHARTDAEVTEQITALLERVNLRPAADFVDKFPYQLSGGQRQRVAIARALAAKPAVLLGDEPISMLDVSIRLDILNLLAALRDEDGLALLYITHDMASARYFADTVAVLYAGQLVESGPAEQLTRDPRHPYTRLLLAAAPDPDRTDGGPGFDQDAGEPPSLLRPPTGCRFHPRCPHAMPVCRSTVPDRTEVSGERWVACWLYANEPVAAATGEEPG